MNADMDITWMLNSVHIWQNQYEFLLSEYINYENSSRGKMIPIPNNYISSKKKYFLIRYEMFVGYISYNTYKELIL